MNFYTSCINRIIHLHLTPISIRTLRRTSVKENESFNASPLLHRSTIADLQEGNKLNRPVVFSILFNMFKTKATSEVAEKIFQRNQHLGKPAQFYHLLSHVNEQGELRYQLKANHNQHIIIPSGKYPYVVLLQEGKYELRIGQMHHYYLANKSFEVVGAGEILFAAGNILAVNDRSGGYHFDEEDELVRKLRKLSLQNVFERVGLPGDKFHAVSDFKVKEGLSPRRRSL